MASAVRTAPESPVNGANLELRQRAANLYRLQFTRQSAVGTQAGVVLVSPKLAVIAPPPPLSPTIPTQTQFGDGNRDWPQRGRRPV